MVSISVPTVPAGILLQNTYDKVDSNNLKPLFSVCLKIGPPITSTLVLLSLPQTMYVMTVIQCQLFQVTGRSNSVPSKSRRGHVEMFSLFNTLYFSNHSS